MTEDEQFHFTFSPKINEASKVLAEQKRARERLAVITRMETMMAEERQKQQQQQPDQQSQETKDDSGIPQPTGSTSLPQGAATSKPPVKTFQRYSFESELTFAPRLNATSMRLARERERQGNVVASSAAKQASEEEYMFTFQPRVSSSSRRIAQNLGTTFMARQQMHLERQRKLLEQGQLPSFKEPMQSRPKRLRHHKLLGEAKANLPSLPGNTSGEEGGQQDSSSDGGSDSGLTPRKRPTRGGEVSKSHPVPSLGSKLGASANGLHGSRRKTLPPKYLPGLPDINNPPATAPPSHQRSQTLPPTTASTSPRRRVNTAKIYANVTRVKNAKLAAERAMRMKRVFTIHGPYPFVRKALRERGWVERFIKPELKKRERSSKEEDSDDDDDGDNGNSSDSDDDGVCDAVCQDSTTEVDSGDGDGENVYGIMVGNEEMLVSRMLRNANPSFIWTCRANTFDSRMLRKDQIYNHFTKANFTTKVGLCMNLRQLPWYEDTDANWFYPRCYRLSVDEEKFDFIDDYRLTAAASVLKVTLQQLRPEVDTPSQSDEEDEDDDEEEDGEEEEETVPSDVDTPRSTNSQKTNTTTTTCSPRVTGRKQKKGGVVPTQVVQTSLTILDSFLSCLEHDDIEDGKEHFPPNLPDETWNTFIQQYYTLVHDCGTLSTDSDVDIDRCVDTLEQFKEAWPQCQIDGTTNMWIVKPGAKSRGREIKVMNKLEDICKLVESTVVKKEGKWVVQKYIEDPLLIHNTKFDIRQWFLVTDWNPLTIWFYKDCYLRFCSQEFSLENFHEAIHLSNNSVQKNYNSPRASNIPANLMWHSKTFKEYLRSDGNGDMWESLVYPGMRQAVIYAMEASQDMIEGRKGSFELYGADFMLDTDLNPWLIEINSSPCMSPSTTITAEMCASVLEDTMKVVLDRRSDKNCDTGRFELAFKQSTIHIPPYIGISLSVEGQAIHRPVERRQSQANNGTTNGNDSGNGPRDSNNASTNKTNSAVNSSQNGSSRSGVGNAGGNSSQNGSSRNFGQQSNSPPKITYSTQGHNNKDSSNVPEPGKNGGPPLPHGYHNTRVKAKSALMQSSRKTAVPAIRLYNNRSPNNRQAMPLKHVEGSDFSNVEQDDTATAEAPSDVQPQASGLTCVSCGGVGSRKTSALPNKENLLFPVPRDVPIMPLPLAMQGIDLQPKMVAKNSVISINALPIQSDSVRIGFHRDATGHHLHRRHHLNNPHHPHYHEGRGMNGKKKSNAVHRTVLNTGIVQPHVRPIAIVSQSYR